MKKIIFAAALVVLSVHGFAQDIPLPDDVPAGLPEKIAQSLSDKNRELTNIRNDLQVRIEDQQNRCFNVLEDKRGQCDQERLGLQQEILAYAHQLDIYDIDAAIARLDSRIAGMRKEMESLNKRLANYSSDVEEWTKLSQETRAKAFDTAKGVFLDLMFEKLSKKLAASNKTASDKVTAEFKKIQAKIDKSGPVKLQKLKKELLAQGRELKTDAQIIEYLGKIKTLLDADSALESAANIKSGEDLVMTMMDVTSLIVGESAPEFSAAVNDIKIWAAVLEGWSSAFAAKERLTQLLELEESDYGLAKKYADEYIESIDQLNALHKEREKLVSQ